MPRYNIKHKNKYYVFSSISDGIIEKFETFKELQEWRLEQYGKVNFKNEVNFNELKGNKMEFKDTLILMLFGGNESLENMAKYFGLLDREDMIYVYKELIELWQDLRSD